MTFISLSMENTVDHLGNRAVVESSWSNIGLVKFSQASPNVPEHLEEAFQLALDSVNNPH